MFRIDPIAVAHEMQQHVQWRKRLRGRQNESAVGFQRTVAGVHETPRVAQMFYELPREDRVELLATGVEGLRIEIARFIALRGQPSDSVVVDIRRSGREAAVDERRLSEMVHRLGCWMKVSASTHMKNAGSAGEADHDLNSFVEAFRAWEGTRHEAGGQ